MLTKICQTLILNPKPAGGLEIPLIIKWLAFTNHLPYPKTEKTGLIVRFSSFRGYLDVSQATRATCLNRPEKAGEFHQPRFDCHVFFENVQKINRLLYLNSLKTNNSTLTTAFRESWMTDMRWVYVLQEFFEFYVPWHCLAGVTFLLRAAQHQRAGSIRLLSVPYKTCFRSNWTTYFSYVP